MAVTAAAEDAGSEISTCSSVGSSICGFSDDGSSDDEGEGRWDVLGRMNSIRRSSIFDRPQLKTVAITRTPAGYGLELEGDNPPIIAGVCEGVDELKCVCEGDRLLEVNGRNVRDLNSEEAEQLISECSERVHLLLHSCKPPPVPSGATVYSGWLEKRGGSGPTPRNWRRRWFVLKDDCIVYYYNSPRDERALGAIVLRNYTVSKLMHNVKKLFSFKLVKGGSRTYCLCADTEQEMNKWAQVLTEAATLKGRETVHFSGSAHNISLSALSIRDPDCHGFLFKQGHTVQSWKKRYCVLKSHQLFYYGKMHHTTAYGVMDLTGYSVVMGKTTDKRFHFHATPAGGKDATLRIYHFYCETAIERERWMQALQKCTNDSETHYP